MRMEATLIDDVKGWWEISDDSDNDIIAVPLTMMI